MAEQAHALHKRKSMSECVYVNTPIRPLACSVCWSSNRTYSGVVYSIQSRKSGQFTAGVREWMSELIMRGVLHTQRCGRAVEHVLCSGTSTLVFVPLSAVVFLPRLKESRTLSV